MQALMNQLHDTPISVQVFLLVVGLVCGGVPTLLFLWARVEVEQNQKQILKELLEIEKKNRVQMQEHHNQAIAYEITRRQMAERFILEGAPTHIVSRERFIC